MSRSAANVRSGSIVDVRRLSQGTNMASVFVNGLMLWPAHFLPKTCARL
jgi:hypothetical protein